ncbi:hypothetical protein C0Q70_17039 [Pomacea canaliculata]|uniref:Secreted protein n=1 Tax=Pomacea canaliculata TaxID=400727 RepID=A0A2T7NRF9_POMCA|nr:hypothetical protein C0Q70_17039 [Pomacea canaliculata]
MRLWMAVITLQLNLQLTSRHYRPVIIHQKARQGIRTDLSQQQSQSQSPWWSDISGSSHDPQGGFPYVKKQRMGGPYKVFEQLPTST